MHAPLIYIPDGDRQTTKATRIAMPNLIFFIFSLQSFLSSLLRKISKMELISACPHSTFMLSIWKLAGGAT
jgi:hypothetical protein